MSVPMHIRKQEQMAERLRKRIQWFHPEKVQSTSDGDEPPYVGRLWGGCDETPVSLRNNSYYTPDGIARVGCGGDEFYTLDDLKSKFGLLEEQSTSHRLPGEDEILNWAITILDSNV
jgi:hypothetical protein